MGTFIKVVVYGIIFGLFAVFLNELDTSIEHNLAKDVIIYEMLTEE